MSDKTYATLVGIVQKFGEEPAVKVKEVGGQTVREFTVKSTKVNEDGRSTLVRVTLWPEWEDVVIEQGAGVFAEGQLATNDSKGVTYYNLTPKTLAITLPVAKAGRTVINAVEPAATPVDTSF